MNRITIHGFLTRDPELKTYTTARGDDGSVCNFSVAVNRNFGEDADFFTCKCFGKRGEAINKFMSKGSEILVSGEMQSRKYEDREGNKRTAWEILVGEFDFCGKRGESKPSNDVPAGFEERDEDDLPF